LREIWYLISTSWVCLNVQPEPSKSRLTLPLAGFCSFQYKLYGAPPVSQRQDNPFYKFSRAAYPEVGDRFQAWEAQILSSVERSCRGPTSPFTCLVDAILNMKDRELRLSFLKVVWLERLLAWKMQTFGLRIYTTRTALPMLAFIIHLTTSIMLAENNSSGTNPAILPGLIRPVAEAVVSCYILLVKARQLYRIPVLFMKFIFNCVDMTASILGISMCALVVSNDGPPRAFLGFSTLLIWIATVLMLRVYRPIGMLLLLLTETLQRVFSLLVLLSFIILG
jgi:hypothetical protein